eukprot:7775660-Pyramimonas_sp.AAC.1
MSASNAATGGMLRGAIPSAAGAMGHTRLKLRRHIPRHGLLLRAHPPADGGQVPGQPIAMPA